MQKNSDYDKKFEYTFAILREWQAEIHSLQNELQSLSSELSRARITGESRSNALQTQLHTLSDKKIDVTSPAYLQITQKMLEANQTVQSIQYEVGNLTGNVIDVKRNDEQQDLAHQALNNRLDEVHQSYESLQQEVGSLVTDFTDVKIRTNEQQESLQDQMDKKLEVTSPAYKQIIQKILEADEKLKSLQQQIDDESAIDELVLQMEQSELKFDDELHRLSNETVDASSAVYQDLTQQVQQTKENVQLLQQVVNDQTKIHKLTSQITELNQQVLSIQKNKIGDEQFARKLRLLIREITYDVIREQTVEMAEALKPVMGEATRLSVLDDPDRMKVALSPVLLGAIRESVKNTIDDLQREIDRRLSRGKIPKAIKDVSSGELLFRLSLTFEVQQLFLIQNETGLLMAHATADEQESMPELTSAMLTAIRDFVVDSFQSNQGLGVIEYDNSRILVKAGPSAYCALVIRGTEPSGVRDRLQEYVFQLHNLHQDAFKKYNGDPQSLPLLRESFIEFLDEIQTVAEPKSSPKKRWFSPGKTMIVFGGGCFLLVLIAFILFFVWFVWKLLPYALG